MRTQVLVTLALGLAGVQGLAQEPVQVSPAQVQADHKNLNEKREEVREKKAKLKEDKKAGAPSEQIAKDVSEVKSAKAERRQAKKKLHVDKRAEQRSTPTQN